MNGSPSRVARERRYLLLFVLLFLSLVLVACDTAILQDLTESQANEVITALNSQNIQAKRELTDPDAKTWSISVAGTDRDRALALLEELSLPGEPLLTFEECMKKGPMIPSPTTEQRCYLVGLQNDLARTIRSVAGVTLASVHLALPEKDFNGRPLGDTRATVLVHYQPRGGQLPITREEIQKMLSHAAPDLKERDVAVTLKPVSTGLRASTAAVTSSDLVDFLGLRVDSGSVAKLKMMSAGICVVVLALGILLFLGGRANDQLRIEKEGLERQLKTRRLAAAAKGT